MKKKKLIIAIVLAAVIVLGGIAASIIIIKDKSNKSEDNDVTTTQPTVNKITVVAKEDTIDSTELKCEYTYYYVNIHQSIYNQSIQYEMYGAGMGAMYTGYDCKKLPENQTYPYDDYKLPDGSTPTWKQYFEHIAIRSLHELHALEDLAEKDSFTIDKSVIDEAYKTIDQLKTQISESATQDGTAKTFEDWLRETYCSDMNETIFKEIIRRQTIASAYVEVLSEKLYEQNLKDDAMLEAEYSKNPELYNYVDFRIFAIYDSKNTANEMLSKITDEESFKKLAAEYATDEQKEGTDYSLDETTLMQYVKKDDYQSTLGEDAVNWLFDKSTKVGDKKVFEYDSVFFVFYVVKTSYRDDATIPVDIRHILYMFDDTATDKEADAAAQKTAAETTAAAINKSSDKLSTFLDYCEKDSDDSGSATNGGLYEYVGKGVYVKEFEEWSLDPNRKEGDIGVIKTSYGYHVMYFVKKHPYPMWKIDIAQALIGDSYTKLIDNTISSDKYILLSSNTIDTLNKELYANTIKAYYSELT